MSRLAFVIVGIAATACRGSTAEAPTCETVGTNFVVLAKRDLDAGKIDDDTRRLVLDQLPAMRDNLVNSCKDHAWAPAVRTCLAGAIDHAALEQCQTGLTADQRNALERGDLDADER